VRTTLAQLQLAANAYVAPQKRDAARQTVADALWRLAQEAPAGSDSQFQFVTAFAQSVATPEHAETLRRLRDGELALDGLEIDTDLSWQLLIGLAAGGAASVADIDAALDADNTAKGGEAAATAKAAIPTAEAKQAAWRSLVDSDELPNTIVRATALGLQHPTGRALAADFIEPYFAALEPIWKGRTYQIAQYLITGLYPAQLADAELRDATRAWLDAHRDIPALRRLVTENLAGVERALSVQERDALS
jgi:aminopeptidase N